MLPPMRRSLPCEKGPRRWGIHVCRNVISMSRWSHAPCVRRPLVLPASGGLSSGRMTRNLAGWSMAGGFTSNPPATMRLKLSAASVRQNALPCSSSFLATGAKAWRHPFGNNAWGFVLLINYGKTQQPQTAYQSGFEYISPSLFRAGLHRCRALRLPAHLAVLALFQSYWIGHAFLVARYFPA